MRHVSQSTDNTCADLSYAPFATSHRLCRDLNIHSGYRSRGSHSTLHPAPSRLTRIALCDPLLRQRAAEEEQTSKRKRQRAAVAAPTMLTSIIALLVGTAAASGQRSSLLARYGDFTIERLPTIRSTGGRLAERPRELKVTSNVLRLKQAPSASLSSSYVSAMRQEGMSAVARAARAEVCCPAVSMETQALTCTLKGWQHSLAGCRRRQRLSLPSHVRRRRISRGNRHW